MTSDKQTMGSAEPAWSTYIHAKGAALGIPVAGNFELTARCNFGCKMCYVHDSDGTDELSADQWIEIGRQAVEKGMVFLLLTGGEPFLRKDFKEIYYCLYFLFRFTGTNFYIKAHWSSIFSFSYINMTIIHIPYCYSFSI